MRALRSLIAGLLLLAQAFAPLQAMGPVPPRPGFRPGINYSFSYIDPRPLAISYWDAEEPASLTLNGSEVVTWTDPKTGLAPTQATSTSRPTYSLTAFNGRPGVVCDNTDDLLAVSGIGSLPAGSSGSEIILTADFMTIAANRQLLRYGANSAGSNRLMSRTVSGPNVVASTGDGASASTVSMALPNGRHVVRMRVEPTQTSISVDGGAFASVSVVPATAGTAVNICSSGGSNMAISAIYVFPLLSAADADAITARFKARGNIP